LDPTDGEITGERVVLAVALHVGGPEGHLRVIFDVEKIGTADVCVSVGVARVKARRLDRSVEGSIGQGLADPGFSGGFSEPAADLADAGVTHAETDLAVGHVQ